MRVEKIIVLHPQRREELIQHSNWLLSVGTGTAPTINNTMIEIPSTMICKSPYEIQQKVYPNFSENYQNREYLSKRAIMASRNKYCVLGNDDMVKQLHGELYILKSFDQCIEEVHQAMYDADFLNKIPVAGVPPSILHLKVNAVIILIRNLNVKAGHCNGTRYIVEYISQRLIKAKKLYANNNDENATVFIPRIPMESKESDFPVIFTRLQFPIIVGYYMTYNRAQGQSLDHSGLLLPCSVFSHGQLYVGLSQTGDPRNVSVYADQIEFADLAHTLENNKCYTRNIVYNEIFDN